MSNWVRTDWDFGVPAARLMVHLRSEAGQMLLKIVEKFSAFPEEMASTIAQVVVGRNREDLQGCTVIGICRPWTHGMLMAVDVIHPSLPKTPSGAWFGEQYLMPCACCRQPRRCGVDDQTWLASVGENRTVECCGKECGDKLEQAIKEMRHGITGSACFTGGAKALDDVRAFQAAIRQRVPLSEQPMTDPGEVVIDRECPSSGREEAVIDCDALPLGREAISEPKCIVSRTVGKKRFVCNLRQGHGGDHRFAFVKE